MDTSSKLAFGFARPARIPLSSHPHRIMKSDVLSITTTQLNLYASVEAAITEAQQICAAQGQGSEACKVAWDIVEELEAADSHKKKPMMPANTTPDLVALMGSFDILVAKIDGKMEQLKATTEKFHELGASDPAIGLEELYHRADEMQKQLAHVQRSLRQ